MVATSATGGLQDELLSERDPAPSRFACTQLERRLRPTAAGHSPRRERLDDLLDHKLAVEEHDIDREAHEEHVDGVGRLDQQARAGLDPVAAEEAAHPGRHRVGDLAALADDDTPG